MIGWPGERVAREPSTSTGFLGFIGGLIIIGFILLVLMAFFRILFAVALGG